MKARLLPLLGTIILVFGIAGCAGTQWRKEGGTQQELSKALTHCKYTVTATRRMAGESTMFVGNSSDMRQCMQGEGWEAVRAD